MTGDAQLSLVAACRRYAETTFNIEGLGVIVAENCPEIYQAATWRAWMAEVRKAVTSEADGLPWALSVDNHGTYKPLSLLDEDEYRFGIRRYMKQSQASRAKAYKLARSCMDVHGVWIDPEEELGREAS